MKILRMVADHDERGPIHGYFEAQRVSDFMGIPQTEVYKHLDILVHKGWLHPHKAMDSYSVQMAPPGWEQL